MYHYYAVRFSVPHSRRWHSATCGQTHRQGMLDCHCHWSRPESGRILQQDPQLNPGRAGGCRAGDRHRGMRTPSRILSGRARRSEAMDDREPRPGIREQGRRSAKTDDQRRGRLFWCSFPAAARSHPLVVEKGGHASGWACYAAGVAGSVAGGSTGAVSSCRRRSWSSSVATGA